MTVLIVIAYLVVFAVMLLGLRVAWYSARAQRSCCGRCGCVRTQTRDRRSYTYPAGVDVWDADVAVCRSVGHDFRPKRGARS